MNDQITDIDTLITDFLVGHCKSILTTIASESNLTITETSDYTIILAHGLLHIAKNVLATDNIPVSWHIANPLNPAILHLGIGIQPFGDGFSDDRSLMLLQRVNLGSNISGQCVNLGTFGIKKIGDTAFRSCAKLSTLTIPEGVTAIGEECFAYCERLTNLELPDTLKTMGDKAFNSCSRLKRVKFSENLTAVSNGAFEGCSNLQSVNLPGKVTRVGDMAFASCERLGMVSLPQNLKSIGQGAFWSCSILQNIRIPDSVTQIDDAAFINCHEKLTMIGSKGSAAEKYASANKLRFRSM